MSAVGYGVALYETAEQFLAASPFDGPGCVLLDMRMPGLTGLQLQERLVAMRRRLTVIFVSGHGDIPTSVLAMKSGAEDFLTKPVDTDVLLRTVERAIERDRTERVRRAQLEILHDRLRTLTSSERKVFDLGIRGKLNKQIAVELGTAERTIKWHRHNLMEKLQLQSLAELVSMAERLGLADAQFLSSPNSK
jgi:FixJ family two-component response regulator